MSEVRQRAPEFRISGLETKIAKEKINAAGAVDDVTMSASTKYYYSENYQPAGANLSEHSTGLKSSIGAKKNFSATGTEISAVFNQDVYTEYGTRDLDYYNPAVTLGITQPLLYNFLGLVDRFDRENAVLSYEIAKLERQISDIETENYYETLYTDWIGYRQIAALSARHVTNAETLYNQVLRKKNAGLVENDDVQEAQSSLLNYRKTRENHLLTLQKIEAEVDEAVGPGRKPDEAYLAQRISAIREQEYPETDFSVTMQSAVMNKSVNQLKASQRVLENRLLPQLDLIAAYTTKNLSENEADAFNPLEKNEYSIGLQMSYTFGASSADAAYQTAVLSLEKIHESARESLRNYTVRRNSTIRSIESSKTKLRLIERNIKALRSQLATQTKKYEQARITLSTLLTTRNQICNAEIELVSAQLALVALDNDYRTLTRQAE